MDASSLIDSPGAVRGRARRRTAGGPDALPPDRVELPARKRALDLVVIAVGVVVWAPAAVACAAAIVALDGRPVLYWSARRVGPAGTVRLAKFRTMRRHADQVANRDTVPVDGVRFLNIPRSSPLYTPVGRAIDRVGFTELPQLWHVLRGQMSIVGNRPLPENVIAALREAHPCVDTRFRVPSGLTGPVQLVGRSRISDTERLALEAAYVEAVAAHYTIGLDLAVIGRTLWIIVRPRARLTPAQAHALIARRRSRRPRRPRRPLGRLRSGGGAADAG